METKFDVVVIGGGHAGVEAALAAARMGCLTALLTFDRKKIGEMSCNPAIGGLGKGQLVKEIDALFGEMGRAIDDTGIQFRTLNSSKGPAVRSSRAQADRDLYRNRILQAVESCPGLTVVEAEAAGFLVVGERIAGVTTAEGIQLGARAVVVTTGTFLRGLMHTGAEKTVGGRVGERAASQLSRAILGLGLRMGRMKTGTPARLSKRSIDFSKTALQPGDDPILPFSFRTKEIRRPQVPCWITHTTAQTHEVIAANVARSPLFNGQIQSRGPRYCPSIEDKIYRFRDKETHHIFLEPEGYESDLVYPNGVSTSLPADVQTAFLRTIPGLEKVEVVRYGYAVEYDHIDPTELDARLAPKSIRGLFFAGQVNGTSGYEEAGAQGMVAGINAALEVQDREPFIVRREQSYIGVMVDDLTTLGVAEPYRMFTSRAEYRLHLREDNADARLTPLARKFGLVSDDEWRVFELRQNRIEKERMRLNATHLKPNAETNDWLRGQGSAEAVDSLSLAELIRRPEISYRAIAAKCPAPECLDWREQQRLETELKFEGYLRRQEQDIARLARMESVSIPDDFVYSELRCLSIEVRERLTEARPQTLGKAARISGVTPAAVSLIAIELRKRDLLGRQRPESSI